VTRATLLWFVALLSIAGSVPAFAHGHGGFSVSIGVPLFAPSYYWGPPPAYYYPPVVAVPAAPPAPMAYVEQGAPQAAPDLASWWYYCPDARAYYPYVKECQGGWQRVAPQPPQ
jgi:hypothetical protein